MKLLVMIETLRRNLKTVVLGCYVVLTLVVGADIIRILFAHGHEAPAGEPVRAAEHAPGLWMSLYHIAESWPGFWAGFGLLGCLVLVLVSKSYGHAGVTKPEDYYDE
jgi:hypothetical protein